MTCSLTLILLGITKIAKIILPFFQSPSFSSSGSRSRSRSRSQSKKSSSSSSHSRSRSKSRSRSRSHSTSSEMGKGKSNEDFEITKKKDSIQAKRHYRSNKDSSGDEDRDSKRVSASACHIYSLRLPSIRQILYGWNWKVSVKKTSPFLELLKLPLRTASHPNWQNFAYMNLEIYQIDERQSLLVMKITFKIKAVNNL